MRVFEYLLLQGGDMSGNINSPLQVLTQMQIASVQANWTGASPVGSLKLQISDDDPILVLPANIIWSDYTGSLTLVNGNGNFLWNCTSIGFNMLRVVYTFTSGTGSLNIKVQGKGN